MIEYFFLELLDFFFHFIRKTFFKLLNPNRASIKVSTLQVSNKGKQYVEFFYWQLRVSPYLWNLLILKFYPRCQYPSAIISEKLKILLKLLFIFSQIVYSIWEEDRGGEKKECEVAKLIFGYGCYEPMEPWSIIKLAYYAVEDLVEVLMTCVEIIEKFCAELRENYL